MSERLVAIMRYRRKFPPKDTPNQLTSKTVNIPICRLRQRGENVVSSARSIGIIGEMSILLTAVIANHNQIVSMATSGAHKRHYFSLFKGLFFKCSAQIL